MSSLKVIDTAYVLHRRHWPWRGRPILFSFGLPNMIEMAGSATARMNAAFIGFVRPSARLVSDRYSCHPTRQISARLSRSLPSSKPCFQKPPNDLSK
jgi:hypothetical protein